MKIKKTVPPATPQAKGPKAAAKAAARAARTPTVALAPTPTTAKPAASAQPAASGIDPHAPATAPAAAAPSPTASRNTSRDALAYPPFNGRRARIMEFQDFTFALNASRPTPLTDEELAAVWQAQFPGAVRFTTKHVAGARRDFLVNRHSGTFAKWTAQTAIDQLRPFAARLTPTGVEPMPAAKAAKAAAA